MIRINLLAPESIKKEERKEIFLLACAFVALVFLTGVVQYALGFRAYKKVQSRVEKTQLELNKFESIVRQVETLQAMKTNLVMKKNIISTLMTSRLTYPVFMATLLDVLPSNIWLKSLTTQLDGEGKIAVSATAEALDNYSIADFMTALSAHPSFSDAELGPINAAGTVKAQTSAFTITFSYQKKKND